MGVKKVFISYSHDSDEHRERVLSFSERLRADGIDTVLDQYVNGSPQQGWPRWMLDQLDVADSVLVVCTQTYYRRFRGHEEPGKGKGADWEGALITQELYDSRSRTLKFVPVFLADPDEDWIPEPLRSVSYYVATSESDYLRLCDFLLGQAGVEPQPLGTLRIRPRRKGTALTFSGPAPSEHAGELISPQEFADDRVRKAAIALDQARKAKSLTMRTLIQTLDRLFERDTFRREPSVGMCATQEWDYRLHGAVQTLRLLEQYEPFVGAEARDLWPRYRELTTEVSRYCQRMAAYLFEPAVGLSELRTFIGTDEFINRIRHKKKWFKRGVSPETCRRIDPHLKKAIRLMERLRDDVLLRLSK
jgi:SEFIR domain